MAAKKRKGGPYDRLRSSASDLLLALDDVEDLLTAGDDRQAIIEAAMACGAAMGFEIVVDDYPEEATDQAMQRVEALRDLLTPLVGDAQEEEEAAAPPPVPAPERIIEKGAKYRVTSGKDAGKEGVLFWVGDAKFGGAIRVGLKLAGGETVWANSGSVELLARKA